MLGHPAMTDTNGQLIEMLFANSTSQSKPCCDSRCRETLKTNKQSNIKQYLHHSDSLLQGEFDYM